MIGWLIRFFWRRILKRCHLHHTALSADYSLGVRARYPLDSAKYLCLQCLANDRDTWRNWG